MTQVSEPPRQRAMASFLVTPSLTHKEFLGLRRFSALDGVRAIAAIMVIAFHFAGPHLAFISGWLGVHLFFVMSGFLITTLLAREESLGGRISLSNFWIRRVFRILPPYYVTLLVTLLVLWTLGTFVSNGGPQSIGWFLGVSPDLSPAPMGFTPAWTIGIEQKFYIVWPVIAFVLIIRRPGRRVLVWLAALLVIVALAFGVASYFVHFAVILFGCGIALAMHSSRGYRFLRILTAPAAGIIALAALLAVQLSAGPIQILFHSQVQLILLYGLCAAALIPSLCSRNWGSTALTWAPLRWLGDRSYSIYLLQVIASWIAHGLFPLLGGPRFFLVVLLVVIVLADGMHRWVEVPSIRFGKRLIDRRSLRVGGASEAIIVRGDQPEGGMPRGDLEPEPEDTSRDAHGEHH
jgi:peptidoglycan/LPS O-acetylase OafA/YrhL